MGNNLTTPNNNLNIQDYNLIKPNNLTIQIDDLEDDFKCWLQNIKNEDIINYLKQKYVEDLKNKVKKLSPRQQTIKVKPEIKISEPKIISDIPLKPETIEPKIISDIPPKNEVEVKSSCKLGKIGEQKIINLLTPHFNIEIKGSYSGDIIVSKGINKLMLEIKNYTSQVPYKEVEKFYRDLDLNESFIGGIFISLNTKITRIERSIYFNKYNHQHVIFLSVPSEEIIVPLVNLLFEINQYHYVDEDKLIKEINSFNDSITELKIDKNIMIENKMIFDKGFNTHIKKLDSIELKLITSIKKITSKIETKEVISDLNSDKFIGFLKDKFPDHGTIKQAKNIDYLQKLYKKFVVDNDKFEILNKKTINFGNVKFDILKTKLYLYINLNQIKFELSQDIIALYKVSIDNNIAKIDIGNSTFPLLDKFLLSN